MTAPILAITSGEPAGIGPDICLDLAFADLPCRPVVLCDKNLLAQRAGQLGKSVILRDFQAQAADPLPKGELEVLHIPLDAECRAGELNPANAAYVLRLLDTAYQGISDGLFAGMVTAPLHKGIINDAHAGNGFFSGHTEYLAEKSHTEQVVMMLTGGGLRVALVTTHLPLKDISAAITKPLIESVVRILEHDLRHKFGIAKPVILVTGLNPHAAQLPQRLPRLHGRFPKPQRRRFDRDLSARCRGVKLLQELVEDGKRVLFQVVTRQVREPHSLKPCSRTSVVTSLLLR